MDTKQPKKVGPKLIISPRIKKEVISKQICLRCNYAGCGSADSWPLHLN